MTLPPPGLSTSLSNLDQSVTVLICQTETGNQDQATVFLCRLKKVTHALSLPDLTVVIHYSGVNIRRIIRRNRLLTTLHQSLLPLTGYL